MHKKTLHLFKDAFTTDPAETASFSLLLKLITLYFLLFFCHSHLKATTLLFSGLKVQMHIIFGPLQFSSPPCASFMSRDLAKLFPSQQSFQLFHLARRIRKIQAPCGIFKSCTADVIRPAPASQQPGSVSGVLRGCLVPFFFSGCEKSCGIPFEAGSSAMRKTGLQRGGFALAEHPSIS